MRLFYKSVVESVILCNCLVWFGGCRQKDLKPLERIARRGGKIIGEVRDLTHICNDKILQKANEILGNENHVLNPFYQYLRSGRRLEAIKCRTERYRKSFVPLSVRMFNNTS